MGECFIAVIFEPIHSSGPHRSPGNYIEIGVLIIEVTRIQRNVLVSIANDKTMLTKGWGHLPITLIPSNVSRGEPPTTALDQNNIVFSIIIHISNFELRRTRCESWAHLVHHPIIIRLAIVIRAINASHTIIIHEIGALRFHLAGGTATIPGCCATIITGFARLDVVVTADCCRRFALACTVVAGFSPRAGKRWLITFFPNICHSISTGRCTAYSIRAREPAAAIGIRKATPARGVTDILTICLASIVPSRNADPTCCPAASNTTEAVTIGIKIKAMPPVVTCLRAPGANATIVADFESRNPSIPADILALALPIVTITCSGNTFLNYRATDIISTVRAGFARLSSTIVIASSKHPGRSKYA